MNRLLAAENRLGQLLAVLVVASVGILAGRAVLERASASQPGPDWCDAGPCEPPAVEEKSELDVVLDRAQVCAGSGYLCAEVNRSDSLRLLRWPNTDRTLVVWVPAPSDESGTYAAEIQRAAARGILRWSGYPLTIRVVERLGAGDPTPDIGLRWAQSLPDGRLGQARYEWRHRDGNTVFRIVDFALVSRSPFDLARKLTAKEVELAAAHEMGHALGLPHSDSERDVMYPENTAAHLSAQDYLTVEALYRLPNGALIR